MKKKVSTKTVGVKKSPTKMIRKSKEKSDLNAIAAYIASAPKEGRMKLKEIRACIKKSAPRAIENLKWGLPAFSYTRILVMYGAFKHHIGFYPTPSSLRAFSGELKKAGFAVAKGSVQFPYDRLLPLGLIKKIVRFRVQKSLREDKRWM